MADRLVAVIASGRLLEVGFCPGRLICELHQRQPDIQAAYMVANYFGYKY